MAPIRPHNKSRNGCKTCRRRKVKCDEVAPICKNCSRRDIECVWADTSCPSGSPERSKSQSQSPLRPSPREMPCFPALMSTAALDRCSLELMHQYTASTCYTFCEEPIALEAWKISIPRLAVSTNNAYLLHSILAVSALHLHTLNPLHPSAEKYSLAAVTHFNEAINSLPSNPDFVDDGTRFVSQILIGIYGFATSRAVHAPSDWLMILRSTGSTFRSRWSSLQHGVISPLIPWITAPLDLQDPIDPSHPFPQSLSTLPLPVCGAPDLDEVRDGATSATYQHAISFLRRSWVASWSPDYHMHAAFFWIILASDSFMTLLSERRPRALILLGHYCAIMQRMEGPWWTRKDWEAELSKIVSVLDARWIGWLDWTTGTSSIWDCQWDDTGNYDNMMSWISQQASFDVL